MKWRHTGAFVVALLIISTAVYALAPLSGIGFQFDQQATTPIVLGKTGIWAKKSDSLPYFTKADGTDIAVSAAASAYATVQDEGVSLTQRNTLDFAGAGISCVDSGGTKTLCTISGGGGGGGTLATDYAAGASAADQTMLIQSGDGGPAIFKANGAATGALVKAQNSSAAELFSLADNAQAYIAGAAADASTNMGVVTDTKTALTAAGRPYLSVQNGGVEQWSYYTTSGVRTIEALAGSAADIIGNGELRIFSNNAGAQNIDLSTSEVVINSGGDIALVGSAGQLGLGAATVLNGPAINISSTDANGASAIGLEVDTDNSFSTSGALLMSIRNANSERAAIDKDGTFISRWARNLLLTQIDGLLLDNSTAATSGAPTQQYSPMLALAGRYFATSSKVYKMGLQVKTYDGATPTAGELTLWHSTNGGSYSQIGYLSSYNGTDGLKLGNSTSYIAINGALTGHQFVVGGSSVLYMSSATLYPAGVFALGQAGLYYTNIFVRHMEHSQAAKPTCTAGAAAGGSASCVVTTDSTDAKGRVTVTLGTTPLGAGTFLTVTFNTAFVGDTTRCNVTPANAVAADNPTLFPFVSSTNTTTMVLTTPTAAYTSGDVVVDWDCDGSTSN